MPVINDTVRLDTLSIVPGSLSATDQKGRPLSAESYEVDLWNALWIWKKKPEGDTVWCRYRVFPLLFTQAVNRKDFETYNKYDSLMASRIIYAPSELLFAQPSSDRLTYSGSYARGISFGNSQDLVVNSSFNLQMQGKIAGDVEVTAAMSDNNIPLQPEGNTQQLQEFDKIFIQFKKDRSTLIAGDYELSRPAGHFMNFYKKLQGLSFQSQYRHWEAQQQTALSVAAARGQYVRKEFMGQEGNQGPYRLSGTGNEAFVVILAGTERVFLDGQLLERGADRDYVIDYNLGEITFTPRRLITKDKRLVVEYQAAERAYLRTVLFAGQQMKWDRITARLAVYNEQDARNQPLQQVLTDSQKAVLQDIGNNLNLAYYPGYDSIGFRTDRPMYRRTDSLGYTVFVFSTDPQQAHYDVRFTYLGSGKGNYRISSDAVNGRVYYWVKPEGNMPQGEYEPVIPLLAPQKQQLITGAVEVAVSQRTSAAAELAFSDNDRNTFSALGNQDNMGVAAMLQVRHVVPMHRQSKLELQGGYETVGRTFRAIERYRPVEFARDWNVLEEDSVNEHLATVSAQWMHPQRHQVSYRASAYVRSDDYRGLRHAWNAFWTRGGFESRADLSYLTAADDTLRSAFIRPTVDVSQRLLPNASARLGLRWMQERNRFRHDGQDSLMQKSFFWNERTVYVRNSDTARIHWFTQWIWRDDHLPDDGRFKKATTGNSLEAGFRTTQQRQTLEVLASYRRLNVADTLLTDVRPDESVLLRLRHEGSFQNGFLSTTTWYEANVGQVQKQEYAYTPVATGAGTHIWIDYNGDGIQQINEFELAPFASDGAFVKVFLPTNEYVRCYQAQFNESLHLSPRMLFRTPATQRNLLSRFSALITVQLNQRTYGNTFWQRFSPFGLTLADSLVLSAAAISSATLYFNRTNPHFGLDVFWQNSRSKNLLTNGLEWRQNASWGSRWRWNITRKVALLCTAQRLMQQRSLQYLPSGDYDIGGYDINPQLSYLPRNTLRFTTGYRYQQQDNGDGESGEKLRMHQGEAEFRYNVLAKSALSGKVTLAQVDFSGLSNSPAGYAMLQGLQRGINWLSQVSAERQLTRLLELSLSYEGRKTGDARWVHTGRMQVRALF